MVFILEKKDFDISEYHIFVYFYINIIYNIIFRMFFTLIFLISLLNSQNFEGLYNLCYTLQNIAQVLQQFSSKYIFNDRSKI